MAITHLHPLSRGSIVSRYSPMENDLDQPTKVFKHIRSNSIDDLPLINPNVLESDWDRWFLAKATAYGRKFFQTHSFQEIFEKEVFPTGEFLGQCIRFTSEIIDLSSCQCYLGCTMGNCMSTLIKAQLGTNYFAIIVCERKCQLRCRFIDDCSSTKLSDIIILVSFCRNRFPPS